MARSPHGRHRTAQGHVGKEAFMRIRARAVIIAMAGVMATAAALAPSGPAASSTASARAAAPLATTASAPATGLIAYASGFILVNPDLDNPSQVFTVRPDGSNNRQL